MARKSLSECFSEARSLLENDPKLIKDEKKKAVLRKFLGGMDLEQLIDSCEKLGERAEDNTNDASRLFNTLNQFKAAGDAFLGFAPESVSIVWFGISSLIMIGEARLQTKLLICGTCDSIANIVGDCVRWEARMRNATEDAPDFDTWTSEIPKLVYNILDFLWNAQPHLDQNKLRRIGSTLKDIFTKELQQKVDALLERYQAIVRSAQAHFEDSVLHESLKTGTKLDQIIHDLKSYVKIGPDVVDALERQALLYELDHQQKAFSHSPAHKIHFDTLNDRLTKIIADRKGRRVAEWLLEEPAYNNWMSDSNDTTLICLKGPRGHGKSIAMMSTYRNIEKSLIGAKPPLICHFFFKRGEKDIQKSRAGLESLLYQLLGSNELRRNTPALAKVVGILNPHFGKDEEEEEEGEGEEKGDKKSNALNDTRSSPRFLDSQLTISDTIRKVAEVIPERVYLMVDALDECQDRREECLAMHLRTIAKTKDSGLRIIISARDSIEIEKELAESDAKALPSEIKIIEITYEKNSIDLTNYLKHEINNVLARRINQNRVPDFFEQELSRLVTLTREKVKGDFTLARMVIANLNQPSKLSLEKRISNLPQTMGQVYMESLESLSPDQQELVVAALKWVVWSVSAITVIEISDHYRELYNEDLDETKDTSMPSEISNSVNGTVMRSIPAMGVIVADVNSVTSTNAALQLKELIENDPYEEPDVKDIIHHLENSGRDFFRIDEKSRIVNVDISIREWIQGTNGVDTFGLNTKSRGFERYRDESGATVFRFTLTPSFVKYGDRLSGLFNSREAHMSLAVNSLCALNNKAFQKTYMSRGWGLEGYKRRVAAQSPKSTPEDINELLDRAPKSERYEIDHWHDHIRALQHWWNERSLEDNWWSELLMQLSKFSSPDHYCRWILQYKKNATENPLSRFTSSSHSDPVKADIQATYISNLLEEPIHLACRLGLHLVVDQLMLQHSRMSKGNHDKKGFTASLELQNFQTECIASYLPEEMDASDCCLKLPFYLNSFAKLGRLNTEKLLDRRWERLVDVIDLEQSETSKVADTEKIIERAQDLILGLIASGTYGIDWIVQKAKDQDYLTALRKGGGDIEFYDWGTSDYSDSALLTQGDKGVVLIKAIRAAIWVFFRDLPIDGWTRNDPRSAAGILRAQLSKEVQEILQKNDENEIPITIQKLQTLLGVYKYSLANDVMPYDKPDIQGRLPLYLAAPFPETLIKLIKYGADVKAVSQVVKRDGSQLDYYKVSGESRPDLDTDPVATPYLESPLLSILSDLASASQQDAKTHNHLTQNLLESAKSLIQAGANLDIRGARGVSLLHLAAMIQDLQFFRFLRCTKAWDVHARDQGGQNVMHALFSRERPLEQGKVNDVMEICRIIVQMKRPDGGDLVNDQDENSRNPLSRAVASGFVEAIAPLIELGADIHDDDDRGRNLFHILTDSEVIPEVGSEIANILFASGLDITKKDTSMNQETPLLGAFRRKRWHLVDFFLEKYENIKPTSENLKVHPLLLQDGEKKSILHLAASIDKDESTDYFGKLLDILLRCGVDAKTALMLQDVALRTPLHTAIEAQNFRAIGHILRMNFSNTLRDIKGYSPLDRAFKKLLKLLENAALNYENAAIEDIIYHLIQKSPDEAISIFFIRGSWDRIARDSFEYLDVPKMMSFYEPTFRDPHGWSLFDYFHSSGRPLLATRLIRSSQTLSASEYFRKPSRIGQVRFDREGLGTVSADGLSFKILENALVPPLPNFPSRHIRNRNAYIPLLKTKMDKRGCSWTNVRSDLILISDHPVPPTDERFYFEIELTGLAKFDEREYARCGIGFESLIVDKRRFDSILFIGGHECDLDETTRTLSNIWYSTRGGPEEAGAQEKLKNACTLFEAPEESFSGRNPTWLGCGTNRLENTFFFTIDGKLISSLYIRDRSGGQYFPTIHCYYDQTPINVNFGAKPFVFGKANDPDWKWDHANGAEALKTGPVS